MSDHTTEVDETTMTITEDETEPTQDEIESSQLTIDDLFPNVPDGADCEMISLDLLPVEGWVAASHELIASVKRLGVIEPIQVYRNDEGTFEIVSGHRRVAAARSAERSEVPACVYDNMSDVLANVMSITANALRSANPLDEYDKIRDLEERGFGESLISKATGMAVGTIRKRMTLSLLIPDLMSLLRSGDITINVAEALAKLNHGFQEEALAIFDREGKLTTADVRGLTRARSEAFTESLSDDLFDDSNDGPVDLVNAASIALAEFDKAPKEDMNDYLINAMEELRNILTRYIA